MEEPAKVDLVNPKFKKLKKLFFELYENEIDASSYNALESIDIDNYDQIQYYKLRKKELEDKINLLI